MAKQKKHTRDWPTILCLSGLDPTGGAGISADIGSIVSLGGHCLPVITALTVQDTLNIKKIVPVSAAILKEQIAALEKDIGFDCIKVGMLADAPTIKVVGAFLAKLPIDMPVVVDPIIAAGGGFTILNSELLPLYCEAIVPYATVITPNLKEAQAFAPKAKSLKGYASALLNMGAESVLITGIVDKVNQTLSNKLYRHDAPPLTNEWPHLDVEAHGSGCTLASAIASMLIFREVDEAVQVAQHFSFHSVVNHFSVGHGQVLPNRFFWAEEDDDTETITAANDEI